VSDLTSAPPRRERGGRSRAGNAMARTRAAVLDGAGQAVEKYGARKTTMADIAALSGVAKATVYNHFRTKEDLYRAAVEAGVRDLGRRCAAVAGEGPDGLARALALAAERLSGSSPLRRVAAEEPVLIAAFLTPTEGPGWQAAREVATAVLAAAGRRSGAAEVQLVLRWAASHAAWPERAAPITEEAGLLAAALPPDAPVAAEAAVS
jgi:AcrR family transcriptional regulator